MCWPSPWPVSARPTIPGGRAPVIGRSWKPSASFRQCKRRLGKTTPRVHIAYMLLRSGLPELDRLPRALQGLEISQVVISTLDLVAAPELEKESLATVSDPESAEINMRLEELAAAGAQHGLAIHYASRSSQYQRNECPENVLRAAVVSTEGEVSPCVYTNVPTSAGDYYVRGKSYRVQSLFFGNVHDLSFPEIWRLPTYRTFRRSWQRGNLANPCQSCLKLIASHSLP